MANVFASGLWLRTTVQAPEWAASSRNVWSMTTWSPLIFLLVAGDIRVVHDESHLQAAFIIVIATVSNMSFLGLGSALWGTVLGTAAHLARRVEMTVVANSNESRDHRYLLRGAPRLRHVPLGMSALRTSSYLLSPTIAQSCFFFLLLFSSSVYLLFL
ncbi:benzoate membrane transport protein [Paraburkholderia sp. BL18I3N2]|uniref:benzoate/H(+) symporter BenE family transporter n=1 Tax=Paraburkholderia sp. BL18I3N2 TaxID=1938799 RepID=UPI000D06FC7D|nr:benzoate/H(+) symporter BenE family transporter [Paraburkholderia sp. BL18I3N2]PRX33354.1 benzoate membrane transport protein [Paraburkholderia sp. BL18I3N2]